MDNRRIWLRLGGVLAAAAVCTDGAAVVSDRAQEAKNAQTAFLGAMETQMRIGCYPSETGSPADLTERERTELQTAYVSRVEQYYTEKNPCRERYIALNEGILTATDPNVEYSESCGAADCRFDSVRLSADRMTAVVQAQIVVWDKRISGNPEQGFSVELPVNRDTITAIMKKESGAWKLDSIDSQTSLLAAVPANDEICRKRYPTFQMARQAADSINDQTYIKEARFS